MQMMVITTIKNEDFDISKSPQSNKVVPKYLFKICNFLSAITGRLYPQAIRIGMYLSSVIVIASTGQ